MGVTVVLAVYIIGYATGLFNHKSATPKSNQVTSTAYVAKADNFQIDFPGTPNISSIPASSSSSVTGGRVYDYSNENNAQEYVVSVTNFSSDISKLKTSDIKRVLQSDLNREIQSNNFSLTGSQYVTFKGAQGLQAKFTSVSHPNANQIDFYHKDSDIVIATFDTPYDSFESFANSYKATN